MPHSIVKVREAQAQDRQALANLLHFEMHVHRHLDWRPPLDWLGARPYLVGEIQDHLCAALVCPPDPPEVAWIRLFAVASVVESGQAWKALWPAAQEQLGGLHPPRPTVAAIPAEPWFSELLQTYGFVHRQNIVCLRWVAGCNRFPSAPKVSIRPMTPGDLQQVNRLDTAAFAPLWQNSQDTLERAYQQAVQASVAVEGEQIVGYQISTASPLGGHLARLAVLPACQGQGIGRALVCDSLEQFALHGVRSVSVNTQQDNSSSLSLYQKIGFQMTDDVFPVYCLN